jgi:hypothetical protein
LAALDECEDCPIDVLLDTLAGSISQSAERDHHFLVEPVDG